MKLKINGFLTLLVVLVTQITFAQDRSVSGTVSDDAGLPIPGATVLVKGTKTGAQTDANGKFTIKAAENETLVISYIGMATKQVSAKTSTVNVKLADDAVQLEGVVVTAQGIKKEKKKLGYAISEVKSKDLEDRADVDVARVLTGKASGVNITSQNGMSGSGTNVVIRGFSSFSGSNQALFIVDNVPFSSDTNSAGRGGDRSDFINGNNGSSRFLDLDPNNIESVNVLKGLAAATLYGAAGRNGVVLITTKTGALKKSRKGNVSVSSSIFVNEIASLPDYQDKYGNGFDQSFGWFFSNWGPSFQKDGVAGWGNNAAFDANGTLPHPYSTASFSAAFPEFAGVRYKWQPYNSVKDFFRKGLVANTSINFNGQSKDGDYSYGANYSYTSDEGFTPGNSVNRNNASFSGKGKFTEKLTVSGILNYSKTEFVSPPVALSQGNGATGTGSSVFGDLFFTPRSIDMMNLPYQNPITGGSVYYRQNNSIQHPLWTVNNSGTEQNTARVFGNATVTYDISPNTNIVYRVGLDNYIESNTNYQNKGGVNGNSGDARTASGFFETWNNNNIIWDHNLILTSRFKISDNINLNGVLGATTRNEIFEQNGVASDGQVIFGVKRHYNFLKSNPIENYFDRNVLGFYAQAEFEYKDYLFLNLAGRRDETSNFQSNKSLFYPSASISFVPTSAFESITSENGLNYLKLRLGFGSSANFGDIGRYPGSKVTFLNVRDNTDSAGGNIPGNEVSTILPNPNIRPELLTEYEVGLESKLFKNRLGINLSLYQRTTKDLIIDQPLDPSTGAGTTQTNIGEIEAKGIELDLDFALVKNENEGFNWSTNTNFTKNVAKVIDLGLDTDRVIYSGFSNLGNVAIPGASIYSIFGSRVLRDANGNLVTNANGNYVEDSEDGIIGDANPDYVINLNNTWSYKNFSLSVLSIFSKGGDIYSSTVSTLLGRGLIKETENREGTFILPGVTTTGAPNQVQINNSDYYFTNILFGPSEMQIYDATSFRLQEVSLGYNLPSKLLEKSLFSSISFKLSGNNLYFRAINVPKSANFDPNTSGTGVGNGVGFDFLNGPSSRRYGFSVKLMF